MQSNRHQIDGTYCAQNDQKDVILPGYPVVQSIPREKQNENHVDPPPKKKKKKLPLVLASIACVLVALIGSGLLYMGGLFGRLDRSDITGDPTLGLGELMGDEEMFDAPDDTNGMGQAAADFASIEKMPIAYSPNVYNVLLIGCDSRKNNFSGRSDSMMIVSINKETGNVHIASLMRAMYVYIPGRDSFNMLNASYAWGGTKMLIDTVETNFRVKIDDHMAVNFGCFEEIVNIAGGVDIQLTQAEARYLRYGSEGTYHMDGSKALAYSRLRHLDTDFKRTGRQRTVIEAMIKKARDMSLGQLDSTAREMFPNINTSMTNMEIISLATQASALTDSPIKQIMLPIECNDEEDPYKTKFYYNKMEMYRFNYRENIKTLWQSIYECDNVEDVPTVPFEPRS